MTCTDLQYAAGDLQITLQGLALPNAHLVQENLQAGQLTFFYLPGYILLWIHCAHDGSSFSAFILTGLSKSPPSASQSDLQPYTVLYNLKLR